MRIGGYVRNSNPNEFSIDAGYSRLFSDYFSGALSFRFIRSDITGGGSIAGVDYNAGIHLQLTLAFITSTQWTSEGTVGNLHGA